MKNIDKQITKMSPEKQKALAKLMAQENSKANATKKKKAAPKKKRG